MLISKARECQDQAAQARRRDNCADTASEGRRFLDAEQRWLQLAASYQSAKRLSDFLDQTSDWLGQRLVAPDRVPGSVSEIETAVDWTFQPFCSACNVPLWFVSVDDCSRARQWVFECRACNQRYDIPPKVDFETEDRVAPKDQDDRVRAE
jgi:hypothetical protein